MRKHAERLEVLCRERPSENDLALLQLAGVCGVECRVRRIKDALSSATAERSSAFAASAATLVETTLTSGRPDSLLDRLRSLYTAGFLHGPTDSHEHQSLLSSLTGSQVSTIRGFPHEGFKYSISQDLSDVSPELAGFQFGPIDSSVCRGALFSCGPYAETLISIDGASHFLAARHDNYDVYIQCVDSLLDPSGQAPDDTAIMLGTEFARFVPFMMALRRIFGQGCFSAAKCYASLIIDDPYLRPRYGFLRHSEFLQSLKQKNYSATIAFIPWNYRRTDSRTSKLFAGNSRKLSICVHGCDHTAGEFAQHDVNTICGLLNTATRRMAQHESRFGVACEKVLVFPQGGFSEEAMIALKRCGFCAVVNSIPVPACGSGATGLTYADFLVPAIEKYSSMPLFMRFYPDRGTCELRINSFLQKPILGVEHHGFFIDGYEKAEKWAGTVNSIRPDVTWAGLGDIVLGSNLRRTVDCSTMECRLFSHTALVENTAGDSKSFSVFKTESDPDLIESVHVNKNPVTFSRDEGRVRFRFRLEGNSRANVVLNYRPIEDAPDTPYRSMSGSVRAHVRRRLCDFRDNVLSRHQGVLKVASAVHDALRRDA